MELKLDTLLVRYAMRESFNRTAYGIEINYASLIL